nr:hypothetical protein [Pseudomonas monteilii]
MGYSLNANLVHKWIRLHNQKATAIQPAFIPLHPHVHGSGSHAQERKAKSEGRVPGFNKRFAGFSQKWS